MSRLSFSAEETTTDSDTIIDVTTQADQLLAARNKLHTEVIEELFEASRRYSALETECLVLVGMLQRETWPSYIPEVKQRLLALLHTHAPLPREIRARKKSAGPMVAALVGEAE